MFPDGKCIALRDVDVIDPPGGPNVRIPKESRLEDVVAQLAEQVKDKKRGKPQYFQAYEMCISTPVVYFLYLRREPSVVTDEEKLRDQQYYYRSIARGS